MSDAPTPPPPPIGKQRAPRVVAELGRPETPSETAARKAASSRAHRENQTAFNLVIAIGVSVVIVVLLVLVVVRPGESQLRSIDYLKVASQAQQQVTTPLVAPRMPTDWTSNRAEITPAGSDGVETWYIGFLTPDTQFIGMTQGLEANQTWVSNELDERSATSSTSIGGLTWTIYDHRSDDNVGNLAYAMVATEDDSTVVLAGTASDAEFATLAKRAAAELQK